MDCKTVIELIPEYSVDMVEGRVKDEIDNHLLNCIGCKTEFEKLYKVMKLVDDLDVVEPPADLWNGVYAKISSNKKKTIWDILKSPIPVKPLRWSLGVSVAILIIVLFFSRFENPANQTSISQRTVSTRNSDEFTQGHIIFTNTDLFADPASTNSTAALAYRSNQGERIQ
jgi:hypothetical protein